MIKKWERLPQSLQLEEVKEYYLLVAKRKCSLFFKRLFDVVVSFLMLAILLPVFLILAIAIKLDSKGPVFYRQVRVTKYNKQFRIFKFRTMVVDADKGSLVTVKGDQRVTKVGKFIRKCRLDEIPQLIDVFRGTMTFVGTRPEVPKYVEKYTPEMMATLLMPAGITSLASIKFKDEATLLDGVEDTDKVYVQKVLPQKMEFNLKALKTFSFFGDIKIMFLTFFAMFSKGEDKGEQGEENTEIKAEKDGDLDGEGVKKIMNKMGENNKFVSIIIPVYNEQRYIKGVIESLINQTYPLEKMEWIFVDNFSTDNTVEIINSYKENYPITILTNPKKKVPASLNLAIGVAKGEYIIRMDAHASFNSDYIEKCVYYLDTTDADNVGGVAETKANGVMGSAIAKMLSSKFGVGGSDFRVGDGNKYVDTVPFGAFRREVFERVGLFNEKLLRSEDNDINSRIRQSGGKIWLAEDIKFTYYCRDTVPALLKMGILNGNALFLTLWHNPKAMSLRHFIPFFFLMSLILFPIVSLFVPILWCVFVLELGAYFLLDFAFSFISKQYKYGLITFWLYPLFHIVYGLGSLLGLFAIKLY